MLNSKKLMLTALAVIFLAGATPLAAQLDGTWAGHGDGSCLTPDGTIIYPWQTWEGVVRNGTFRGEWKDSDGNCGTFKGDIISITPTTAYCEGTWTWISPSGIPPVKMGPFEMVFNYVEGTCEGEWWPSSGAPGGTMWGWRIGD